MSVMRARRRAWTALGAGCATLLLWLWWSEGGGGAARVALLLLEPSGSSPLLGLTLTPRSACSDTVPNIVILVTSYVGHVELRSAHRRALPQRYLNTFNTTRVFLLAKIPTSEKYITQNAIKDEARHFGDILQGGFVEHYHNLTYKHLMGLHWAGTQCNNSKYIIKLDDDTVFNFEKIYHLVIEFDPSVKFMAGLLMRGMRPHREQHNKWYVSSAEYPLPAYPLYLTGWLYATTPATADAVSRAATYHQYFWIDDIFVTGILTSALNIKLHSLGPEEEWLGYYELLECCLRDMVEKKVTCDCLVGPNAGRDNLLLEFYNALRHCEASKNCTKRPEKSRLRQTCIAPRERTLFGSGKSQVEALKVL